MYTELEPEEKDQKVHCHHEQVHFDNHMHASIHIHTHTHIHIHTHTRTVNAECSNKWAVSVHRAALRQKGYLHTTTPWLGVEISIAIVRGCSSCLSVVLGALTFNLSNVLFDRLPPKESSIAAS